MIPPIMGPFGRFVRVFHETIIPLIHFIHEMNKDTNRFTNEYLSAGQFRFSHFREDVEAQHVDFLDAIGGFAWRDER